jgi:hypothetical protein
MSSFRCPTALRQSQGRRGRWVRPAACITLSVLATLVFADPDMAVTASRLTFGQPSYFIHAGDSFFVTVSIDGDPNTIGLQPVPSGLFSYGFEVQFSPAPVVPQQPTGAIAEFPLDYNGFAQPAQYESQSGYSALRGNINLNTFPLTPYTGTQLATFYFKDQSVQAGSYYLQLAIHDFAPTDDEFVDGAGRPMDGTLLLDKTLIVVTLPTPPDVPPVRPMPALPEHLGVALGLVLLLTGFLVLRASARRQRGA